MPRDLPILMSAPMVQACIREVGDWKGHLWLALKDGRVLDPTADQYGGDRPAVYLGKPDPEIHCKARMFVVAEAHSLRGILAGKKRRRKK